MFNNWYVMSAVEAQKYCNGYHENSSIVISINNSFESPVKLTCTKTNKIIEILTLSFDDVLKHNLIQDSQYPHIFTDEFGRAYSPICKKDAEKIHDIVMRWYKSSENVDLIVHCEMGVSRSAAVMAAILKGLYNDDMPIYKNSKYRPNPDVYRAVFNTFEDMFVEDNLEVDIANLRFSSDRTPFNYRPIFKIHLGWNSLDYVPSIKMCKLFPELRQVKETVECWGSGLPYCRFTFAKIGENEETQKGQFASLFSVDNGIPMKDTVAFKIVQAYQNGNIPDIHVTTVSQKIDGEEYKLKEYSLLLYNINSLYFYQESLPFKPYDKENVTTLIEIEYSMPNGYKSWRYCEITNNLPLTEIKGKYKPQGIDIGATIFYLMFDVYSDTLYDYVQTEKEDACLWAPDVQFLGISKKNEETGKINYSIVVLAQNNEGKVAEIDYTTEEWKTDYPKISGIRLIKIN